MCPVCLQRHPAVTYLFPVRRRAVCDETRLAISERRSNSSCRLDGILANGPRKRLLHANPDAVFCLVTLVTMSLFVVGTIWLATKRGGSLRRPSFNRFPLNFWYDPLEFLFVGTFTTLAMAIGATLRLPAGGTVGYWMTAFYWCIFGGWIIGQLIGYAIYRERIAPA